MKFEYRVYRCKACKALQRAWVESEAYKARLCPSCLDKVSPVPDVLKPYR